MNKLFIILLLIILLILPISYFIGKKQRQKLETERQKIEERQLKEWEDNNLKIKQSIKAMEKSEEQPFKDKGEIPKAIGAVIEEKIKLADLELTETEYAVKKIELTDQYRNKQLNYMDGQRFIAVLNREMDLWKKLNKRDFVVSDFKSLNDIIVKLNL